MAEIDIKKQLELLGNSIKEVVEQVHAAVGEEAREDLEAWAKDQEQAQEKRRREVIDKHERRRSEFKRRWKRY